MADVSITATPDHNGANGVSAGQDGADGRRRAGSGPRPPRPFVQAMAGGGAEPWRINHAPLAAPRTEIAR